MERFDEDASQEPLATPQRFRLPKGLGTIFHRPRTPSRSLIADPRTEALRRERREFDDLVRRVGQNLGMVGGEPGHHLVVQPNQDLINWVAPNPDTQEFA